MLYRIGNGIARAVGIRREMDLHPNTVHKPNETQVVSDQETSVDIKTPLQDFTEFAFQNIGFVGSAFFYGNGFPLKGLILVKHPITEKVVNACDLEADCKRAFWVNKLNEMDVKSYLKFLKDELPYIARIKLLDELRKLNKKNVRDYLSGKTQAVEQKSPIDPAVLNEAKKFYESSRAEAEELLRYYADGQRELLKLVEYGGDLSSEPVFKMVLERIKSDPARFLNFMKALQEVGQTKGKTETNRFAVLRRLENKVRELAKKGSFNGETGLNTNLPENLDSLPPGEILAFLERKVVADCGEFLKQEKSIVDSVNLTRKRRFFWTSFGAAALLILSGSGGYYVVQNSESRRQVYALQQRVNRLIDNYSTTNYAGLYSAACDVARQEMSVTPIVTGASTEEANIKQEEYNLNIFKRLALFLEPEPTNEFLRIALDEYRADMPRLEGVMRANRRPEAIPGLHDIVSTFDKYFNDIRGKDELRDHDHLRRKKNELRNYLSRLPDELMATLPIPFKSLVSHHLISQRQVPDIPEHLLSDLTDDLRPIFGNHNRYFQPIVVRELTVLEARVDDNPGRDTAFKRQCSPSGLIGSNVLMYKRESGKLVQILMAPARTGLRFYQNLNEPQVRRRINYVLRCHKEMYNIMRNYFVTDVFGKLKSNHQALMGMAGRINSLQDLATHSEQIDASETDLSKFARLVPVYARVLTGLQIPAEQICNRTKEFRDIISLEAMDLGQPTLRL